MKTFGFRVNNDAFEKNSWYFRNALVRANYTNLQKGVHATTKFLEMFFGNLLLGANYELKNRYMHIDYTDDSASQSISAKVPKYQFDTLDCSLEELAVLELVAATPTIKQQELVSATGKSIATIKRIMKALQDKNYIRRENGKRYGKWEILIEQEYFFDNRGYIVHNGMMKDLSVLQEAPFTDHGSIVEVFTDLSVLAGIRNIIEKINLNAAA